MGRSREKLEESTFFVLHHSSCQEFQSAGAVIERMGGEGSVVNAYIGDKKPSQDIASCFNFPATFIKAIPVSFATLRDHLNSQGMP